MLNAEQKTTLKAIPMGMLSWFTAGVSLTLGYRFALWLLQIVHLG
jgi:hypothetical protein